MTSASSMLLWIVKWLRARDGSPRSSSSVTPPAAARATSRRKAAAAGRRTGVTTAVAGTGEGFSAGGGGIAGRPGMSRGIGAGMPPR